MAMSKRDSAMPFAVWARDAHGRWLRVCLASTRESAGRLLDNLKARSSEGLFPVEARVGRAERPPAGGRELSPA